MSESKLVFYGDSDQIQQNMLYLMEFVEIRVVNDEKAGFYLNENKYGTVSEVKLSLDLENLSADAVLLYRYLSDTELDIIKNADRPLKYFILAHKNLDLSYIKKIGLSPTQIVVLCGQINSPSLKNKSSVSKVIDTKNFSSLRSVVAQSKTGRKESDLPLIFLLLIKFFVSPINSVKGFVSRLKHSNIRVLDRFVELVYFAIFILNAILWKYARILGGGAWYSFDKCIVLLRVCAIKIGFGIRHVLLMTGFKSFGVFIDTSHAFIRMWDKFMDFVVYKFLYRIYYRGIFAFGVFCFYRVLVPMWQFISYKILIKSWNFFWYKCVFFLYYRVGYFLYYNVWFYLYYVILTNIGHFFKYQVRHFILMSLYKIYGLLYDMWTLFYRIFKLYLLYPVRKTYWFCSYQYKKRIMGFLK